LKGNRIDLPTQRLRRVSEFDLVQRTACEAEPVGILYDAPFDVVVTDINVFQPDLAFFSEGRRRFLTDRGAEGAPDLVVEILSPKTAHLDLEQKRLVYAHTVSMNCGWDPVNHAFLIVL
jgi:Uma2 family endonuclease